MVESNLKKIIVPIIITILMAVLIWGIGYQTLRTDFALFMGQYILLFGLFYSLWLNRWKLSFKHFFAIAVILRLVLLFASPELSNDFYRFIWDGEMLTKGINPFAHVPNDLISNSDFMGDQYMRTLYHGMGELSQAHYTPYAVVNQFLFYIPALASDSIMYNVILLKIIIILADIGAIFFAKKIAEHLSVTIHNVWLYALNPFIILEFSGNLHFEGVMIFFLLGAIYFILKNNWLWGGALFGFAVQVKLIPLMLIPFVFKKLKWKNTIGFLAITGFVILGVGGLMLNREFFGNMMDSVNEYFIRFQFNSSFYDLIVNHIYYHPLEYDYTLNPDPFPDRFKVVGLLLSYIATGGILVLALLRAYHKDLDMIKGMLFAFMIYYAFATTVHPWYVSLILVLSIYTQYKFGLIWSIVIMLSYYAYSDPDFKQNVVLQAAEYLILYTLLIFEIRKYWEKKAIGIQLKEFFGK